MSEDKSNLVDQSYNGAYDTAYTTPSYGDPTIGDAPPTYHTPPVYSVQDGQDMFSNGPTTMPTSVQMQSVVTSNDMYRQTNQIMPENYITHNIIVLIFCSLIFGIIGLIKGSQVSTLYMSGNYDAAQAASLSARMWYRVGMSVGCFVKAFLIGYIVVYYAF